MTSITISPGKIISLWRLLNKLHEYGDISKEKLISILKLSSLGGGSLPYEDGMQIAFDLKLIRNKRPFIRMTQAGIDLVVLSNNEFPSNEIFCNILLKIIKNYTPEWIAFACRKIEEIEVALPNNWKEVLKKGGLLSLPLSENSSIWWKELRSFILKMDDEIKKKTGDLGEKLTYHYEWNRLTKTNYTYLARMISWVSKESDLFGYDIASFHGVLNPELPRKRLFIEVKSSRVKSKNQFVFYISKNEWNIAKEKGKNYYFYLWNNINENYKEDIPYGPFILPSYEIEHLIPVDRDEDSEWIKTRIVIKMSEYCDKFIQI
jgi:hypothetical protein